MSLMVVISSDMHKIAQFAIDVKFRRPGNVVGYLPVEFEVFQDNEYYRAVPLIDFQTRLLTNLRCALSFQLRKGKICCEKQHEEAVISDLVARLRTAGILEPNSMKYTGAAV